MDLRPELLPPPVASQRLEEISYETKRISNLTHRGEPMDAAVAAFNEMTEPGWGGGCVRGPAGRHDGEYCGMIID
ncbi:hypothetical protein [Kitasatospora azatica]|uniref:hypothetical protein n=1 Tax=Kitasatospora azatica TaxID=58347 RepID=UPI0012F8DD4D|nr:hypothetical protein [Kitasatospora azatica]